MQKAVIDMGTNTFHLLVAAHSPVNGWETVLRHRVYVKLAEKGLENISEAAFERGLRAMSDFRAQLDALRYPVDSVRAYGTAALRSAENAPDFLARVRLQTGIPAKAISGDDEARLIYQGVRQAVPWPTDQTVLIMDIGGGSVEFILADRAQIYWQQSFNIGVAVLHRRFHHHDPIHPEEINAIEQWLNSELEPLWQALTQHPAGILVGAAGAFDTIDLFALDPATKPLLYGQLQIEAFEPVYQRFVQSTLRERLIMPLLLPERVDMVVAAVVLIRFILQKAGIREIYTSMYSMKEGMLVEEL